MLEREGGNAHGNGQYGYIICNISFIVAVVVTVLNNHVNINGKYSTKTTTKPTSISSERYKNLSCLLYKHTCVFLKSPFSLYILTYSEAQHDLSLSPSAAPPPPPPISSPFSVTLMCHLSFTSHNIHYIIPITRNCHANIFPSNWTRKQPPSPPTPPPKKLIIISSHFSSFLNLTVV